MSNSSVLLVQHTVTCPLSHPLIQSPLLQSYKYSGENVYPTTVSQTQALLFASSSEVNPFHIFWSVFFWRCLRWCFNISKWEAPGYFRSHIGKCTGCVCSNRTGYAKTWSFPNQVVCQNLSRPWTVFSWHTIERITYEEKVSVACRNIQWNLAGFLCIVWQQQFWSLCQN